MMYTAWYVVKIDFYLKTKIWFDLNWFSQIL